MPESKLTKALPAGDHEWLWLLPEMVAGEPGVWRVQRIVPPDGEPKWRLDRGLRQFVDIQSLSDYVARIRQIVNPPGQPGAVVFRSMVNTFGHASSPLIAEPENGTAPALSMFHQVIQDAVTSLWGGSHFPEAIEAAAKAVTSHLQERLGRSDIDGQPLIQEAFAVTDPEAGRPRLRLCDRTNEKLFKDRHIGATNFGKGCFALFRNTAAHGHAGATTPEEAFEQLGAFSALLRLIDRAEVVRVGQ